MLDNINLPNIENVQKLLEHIFATLQIHTIEILGSGMDSIAYLVNHEFVFKIKYSVNQKNDFAKEKAICDFLNRKLNTNIKIPQMEYFYSQNGISILGYRKIEGRIATPEIYNSLSEEEKELFKKDIAAFLRRLHNLDYTEIKQYQIDNHQNILNEYELLKTTMYNQLTNSEKEYIEDMIHRLSNVNAWKVKKCLCHNDFNCDHFLIDENNKLCGIIDFGDAGITDEYSDFVYLLKDSDEELGKEAGIEILDLYGNINAEKIKEFQYIFERYYPVSFLIYGIENNKPDFIEEGRKRIQNIMNK